MRLFAFIAGFLEQGTAQSSTRLVGIGSFCAAIAYAFVKKDPDIAVLGMLFTNGLIALGLRKSPEVVEPPKDAG